MTKRKFNSKKLYNLARVIILVVSGLALALAIYWGHLLKTNEILYSYEKFCATYASEDPYCMDMGFKAIRETQGNFDKALVFSLGLPIMFFGGTVLYKYLFPEIKRENNEKLHEKNKTNLKTK